MNGSGTATPNLICSNCGAAYYSASPEAAAARDGCDGCGGTLEVVGVDEHDAALD